MYIFLRLNFKIKYSMKNYAPIGYNVPSIADGGALYHQSLIEKQKV